MKIGILIGIAEAAVGLATSNPALIGKGALDAGKKLLRRGSVRNSPGNRLGRGGRY